MKKIKNQKPRLKWQKGDFDRHARFKHVLPYPLLLLCKLVNITPRQLITDFMENLAQGNTNPGGRENARAALVEYFLLHGYGQPEYSPDEIRTLFREMNALGNSWPQNGSLKLMKKTARWQRSCLHWWFRKNRK